MRLIPAVRSLLNVRRLARLDLPPLAGLAVCLSAAGWLWVATYTRPTPLSRLGTGGLLLAAAGLLAAHDLRRTGAEPRRRTRAAAAAVQARRWWPTTAAEVAAVPEARRLRQAAAAEPGPVFPLLNDARPEVRTAAFAALTARDRWRPTEAAAVLAAAHATVEPGVRAAAVTALGAVDDPAAAAGLTGFFRDPDPGVRAAAVTAALRDAGRKWAFVRDGARLALADPKAAGDPLPGAAGRLPAVAVCDLTAWAAEPVPLGPRAVKLLTDHYAVQLRTGSDDHELRTSLTGQVTDLGTPAALRVELAALLRELGLLSAGLLDRMTNPDQPGPVRLLAAEALLAANPNDPDGQDVLRGLARQPNREMALAVAAVLQQRLGVDVGLPTGPLAANSRPAGEVAKRVLQWAVNGR